MHAPGNVVTWEPSADLFLGFLAYLSGRNSLQLSHDSTKKAVAAVRFHALALTGKTPPAFLSMQTWKALKAIKKVGRQAKKLKRLPITAAMLLQMLVWLDQENFNDCMFITAACLGVRGLLRGGEYLAKDVDSVLLRRRDVKFVEGGIELFLRVTKTDTDVIVRLFRDPEGSTICPVKRVEEALRLGPNKDGDAALLQNSKGNPLSYSAVMTKLRWCVKKMGHNMEEGMFGTHSFRIGGATDLARMGLPGSVIQARGRWTSLTYLIYLRTADEDLRRAQHAQLSLANKHKDKSFQEALGLPFKLAEELDMESLDIATSFFSKQ